MKQFLKDAAVTASLCLWWATCTNIPLDKLSNCELFIVGVLFAVSVEIVRWGLKK
jgi:hypothetical protein